MSGRTQEATTLQYELEVEIHAPREKVWSALVDEADAWWLPDFHMLGEGSVVTFDAKAGGHLVERRADGSELLWYTVQMVQTGESVHLAGYVFPEWGGPSSSLLSLRLEETDDGTLLRVHDAHFGHVTAEDLGSLESGWRSQFTDGLKRHVER